MRAAPVLALSLAFAAAGCGGRLDGEDSAVDAGDAADLDEGVGDEVVLPPPDAVCCGPGAPCVLMLDPSSLVAVVDVAGGTAKPATVTYRAELPCEDGTRRDLSSVASFRIDEPVGTFVGPEFVSLAPLPSTYFHGLTTLVRVDAPGAPKPIAGFAELTLIQMDLSRDLFVGFSTCFMRPIPASHVLPTAVGAALPDLSVRVSTEPNPDGVDTKTLVEAVRAVDEGLASRGCAPHPAKDADGDGIKDTFTDLAAGAVVCFEVILGEGKGLPKSGHLVAAFADVVSSARAAPVDRRLILFRLPTAVGAVC